MKVYLVCRKRFGIDEVIHVCSDAGDANDKIDFIKRNGEAGILLIEREVEEPLGYWRVDVSFDANEVRYSPTEISTCRAKMDMFIRDRHLGNCDGYMYVRAASDLDAVSKAIKIAMAYVGYR